MADNDSDNDSSSSDVVFYPETFLEKLDTFFSTLLPIDLTLIMKQYIPNCSWTCVCKPDPCGRFGCTTEHEKCVLCDGGCCEMCETVCESCRRKHICSRCVTSCGCCKKVLACVHCMTKCNLCEERKVCHECLYECRECDDLMCANCKRTCEDCEHINCAECIRSCKICD